MNRKSARIAQLEEQVAELMESVEENRRLNERLADVLDVVTELLVPAADRERFSLSDEASVLLGGGLVAYDGP